MPWQLSHMQTSVGDDTLHFLGEGVDSGGVGLVSFIAVWWVRNPETTVLENLSAPEKSSKVVFAAIFSVLSHVGALRQKIWTSRICML